MTNVRPAMDGDAAAMGALHVDAWRAAYADVMPVAFLAGLRAEDRAAMWRRSILDGRAHIFVATDDADVVRGFACAGPERTAGVVGELDASTSIRTDAGRAGRGRVRGPLPATPLTVHSRSRS